MLSPMQSCPTLSQRKCTGETTQCPELVQELEATAARLERDIPAIGAKTERLTAELAKQEHVRRSALPPATFILTICLLLPMKVLSIGGKSNQNIKCLCI